MSSEKQVTDIEAPEFDVYVRGWMASGKVRGIVLPRQNVPVEDTFKIEPYEMEADKYYKARLKKADVAFELIEQPIGPLDAPPTAADLESTRELNEQREKEYNEKVAAIEKAKQKNFASDRDLPASPSDLVIEPETWNLLLSATELDQYSLLLGPKGCGKSHTAKALAKTLGYDYFSFNMGAATKPKQTFVGVLHARETKSGVVETQLIESEFLKAFQSQEKVIIFLDEITRIPQQASNYLMTILDRDQSYIYVEELGKRIYRGPNVRFVCAGNVGNQYTDTRTLDGAFWDRFNKLTVDYMSQEDELNLALARVPGAPKKEVVKLISAANKTREAEKAGGLSSAISTRQVLDMAKLLAYGNPFQSIVDRTFLNNFVNGNIDERETVKTIIQA